MIVIAIVIGLYFAIQYISEESPFWAGIFIACCNGLLPTIMKTINETEEHMTQGECKRAIKNDSLVCADSSLHSSQVLAKAVFF